VQTNRLLRKALLRWLLGRKVLRKLSSKVIALANSLRRRRRWLVLRKRAGTVRTTVALRMRDHLTLLGTKARQLKRVTALGAGVRYKGGRKGTTRGRSTCGAQLQR